MPGPTKKEKPLPYEPRVPSTAVVEVQEVAGQKVLATHGTHFKEDLIGKHLPASMRLVSQFGQIAKIDKPSDLLTRAIEYFEWAVANPIEKEEMIKGGLAAGMVGKISIPRPFTIVGLRAFVGLSGRKWKELKGKGFEQFHDLIDFLEEQCNNQKFEHAAVGLYNPSIISRDLGLVDKKEQETTKITKKVFVGMVIKDSGPEEHKEEAEYTPYENFEGDDS